VQEAEQALMLPHAIGANLAVHVRISKNDYTHPSSRAAVFITVALFTPNCANDFPPLLLILLQLLSPLSVCLALSVSLSV
jgi:hypothetical protein